MDGEQGVMVDSHLEINHPVLIVTGGNLKGRIMCRVSNCRPSRKISRIWVHKGERGLGAVETKGYKLSLMVMNEYTHILSRWH